jgi:UrcA family protein
MKLAAALVASMLSLTMLTARAEASADEAYSLTVQFADLDLNGDAGIAKLYVRIRSAARRVCEQQLYDPQATPTYAGCVKRAVSAAVARIDTPRLSDYVAQLDGKPAQTASANFASR